MRNEKRGAVWKDGGKPSAIVGPEANEFEKLEALFKEYGEIGSGQVRLYLHNDEEQRHTSRKAGTFTPWSPIKPGSDLLFYEGLHGGG